ncbi:hypothetical protein CYK57_00286 [Actinobacillus pleuropneumoniae]|uniref:Uncharacterized protein n=1 Tax=Actinobacillus pleuropneumoniae serotype 7 (strain AP76) TaxID=537457 RepID=B3H037_ACTP7|nr:hypothetical protein APP7_0197 [Actinobacillus pleuropneumoniae serovar 7 str. AP76]EFM88471.1 hypothetical protein appser2_1810 [Actinobacillus pleuropneumoniae serovar 2 str. S1536]EFM90615.1 hypothetical protein appser4_2190 [Actinobacillus pleuropneumoniae serovar 4 str. M62]EFM95106.1 hypothetical protein appser9_2180 [Actinobacillus pleuropneumoniae serovar 9 str. CVJ13261]EFM99446.1 hypothetical protein appser11_2180 [Actinobacillus pleuropneumoniae serovar 11 str. 56153]EFN01515.1 h
MVSCDNHTQLFWAICGISYTKHNRKNICKIFRKTDRLPLLKTRSN